MSTFVAVMIINIGSIGLDTTRTPFGTVEEEMGGSASFFGLASSYFAKTGLIGVIGSDFPPEYYKLLKERMDLTGLEIREGKNFRFDSSFSYDLGTRTTIKTELNVFGEWTPKVPQKYLEEPFYYLGNINPEQQLQVLDQIPKETFTVADTIELWINIKKPEFKQVISRVNGVVINDDELRQLCETHNLITGAKKVLEMGAEFLIIKKGEHGAILFTEDMIFPTCGYPLEEVVDPTGAGDSFAGGFMGHLARNGDITEKTLRKAVVYGNVLGSFAVEAFGVDRFRSLTLEDIENRYRYYRNMITF